MIDLHRFERILFFTGAGLSRESGIATYRGEGGLWHEYDYREYACQRAFDRDPEKVWEFHDKRRAFVGAREPCAGHLLIAEIQRARPGTGIVTQNIDGLHQRAGASGVVELHGSLWRVRCDHCRTVEENHEIPIASRRCVRCGGWLRPDIVWFEDSLDPTVVALAERYLSACDVLVSVGTSGVVHPAAAMPALARAAGAVLVEVNPEETIVSGLFDHHLRGPASGMLRALWP